MDELTPGQKGARTRRANRVTAHTARAREIDARRQGMEALSMPVVTADDYSDTRIEYSVTTTATLRWWKRSSGTVYFRRQEARLLDLEPQAAYTAMQNQIDSLQAQQQQLLAAAFETGPEITLEHLEAVQAAGERAVERLNAEAE